MQYLNLRHPVKSINTWHPIVIESKNYHMPTNSDSAYNLETCDNLRSKWSSSQIV